MSGTIDELSYDSEATYHDQLRYRAGLGEGDSHLVSISTENIYQLSNNGSWYAGAHYEVQVGGLIKVTQMTDNAAGTQWYYDYDVAYGSSWAANGVAVHDEATVHAKDGNTYVYDQDSNGNTIASATFITATGKMTASNNFAVKVMYNGDAGPDRVSQYTWFQPGWETNDGNGTTIISPTPPDGPQPQVSTGGQLTTNETKSVAEDKSALFNLSNLHSAIEKDFQLVAGINPTFASRYDNTGTLRTANPTLGDISHTAFIGHTHIINAGDTHTTAITAVHQF